MKKLLFLVPLFLVVVHTWALPLYEPFNYTPGSNLAGQSLGTNLWELIGSNFPNGPQPTNVTGNLSYANMPPPSGNSVQVVPGTNMAARLNIGASVTSGRIYYSMLLKITDISAVSTAAAD